MARRAFLASSASALAGFLVEPGVCRGRDAVREPRPALPPNIVLFPKPRPSQPVRVKGLAATLGGDLRSIEAQMPTDTRTGKTVERPDRI